MAADCYWARKALILRELQRQPNKRGCERAKGQFTLAIFAAILVVISRRVNYWRFRGDSLHGRFKIALEIAAKIASVNWP